MHQPLTILLMAHALLSSDFSGTDAGVQGRYDAGGSIAAQDCAASQVAETDLGAPNLAAAKTHSCSVPNVRLQSDESLPSGQPGCGQDVDISSLVQTGADGNRLLLPSPLINASMQYRDNSEQAISCASRED